MLFIRRRPVNHSTGRRRWNQQRKNKPLCCSHVGTIHSLVWRIRTRACRSEIELYVAHRLWQVWFQNFAQGNRGSSTFSKLQCYHFFILGWHVCDDGHRRQLCLTCIGIHSFCPGTPLCLSQWSSKRLLLLSWTWFTSFLHLLITNAVCGYVKLVLHFSSWLFQ